MIELETQTQTRPDVAVTRVTGRLTMVNAAELRTAVNKAVDEGRATVVVDLGACEFMDSSGLGAIIGALKVARQAGGDLRIARLSPQVRTVLELTNLDRVLRPYGSVEEALDDR